MSTPDAAGPGPLGMAFASLGRMEELAVLGSTQHRPSVASRGPSDLLAMEKLCSQFRPQNHRSGHQPPDRPNESRQSTNTAEARISAAISCMRYSCRIRSMVEVRSAVIILSADARLVVGAGLAVGNDPVGPPVGGGELPKVVVS